MQKKCREKNRTQLYCQYTVLKDDLRAKIQSSTRYNQTLVWISERNGFCASSSSSIITSRSGSTSSASAGEDDAGLSSIALVRKLFEMGGSNFFFFNAFTSSNILSKMTNTASQNKNSPYYPTNSKSHCWRQK